jgi:hypothetical protein
LKTTISAYFEMTKPRITMLVLVTAYLGYYLGLRSQGSHMATVDSWLILFYLILGTWATSAGAAVLNQVIERRHDAKMARTKNRPLVIGKISPNPALMSNHTYSYVAYNVEKTGDQQLDNMEDIEVLEVDLNEIPTLITNGEIDHSLVVSAFYLLDQFEK